VALEWSGAGVPDAVWAGILVVVGAVAGAFTVIRFRNPWVGWAVAWALLGIVLNRWEDQVGIAATALACMVLVAALAARAPHLEHAG
jgi:hypothetical protein